jgi:hypothetical protein
VGWLSPGKLELLDFVCGASHFQVALFAADMPEAYPENIQRDALATYSSHGVAVTTAWDENGTVPPDVLIGVYLMEAVPDLKNFLAIAQAPIAVSAKGVLVGNAISGDLRTNSLKEGTYDVLVAADTREPFKARCVGFFLTARI